MIKNTVRTKMSTSRTSQACNCICTSQVNYHGPDLQNILRQSYNNAKVTIDLRQAANLQNILRRTQDFSEAQFTCSIGRSSEIVFVN